MYVVTRNGYKLPVDDSSIPEDEYVMFQQAVGLYTDNTILKPIWILELSKSNHASRNDRFELDFAKDLKYYHYPTQEEILYAMSAYGCTRGDIAIVRKGFELDMDIDETE